MKYNAKTHPESIIKFMGKGHSVLAWAGLKNISRKTVYAWRKTYPEFKEAMDIGYCKGLLHWEKMLQNSIFAFRARPSVPIFVLKTRFHREYGDLLKDKGDKKGKGPQEAETIEGYLKNLHALKLVSND